MSFVSSSCRASVQDLLTLRALTKRQVAGIDLDKLNQGERKRKKKKVAESGKSQEDVWQEQMQKGGLISHDKLAGARENDEEDDDEEEKDSEAISRRKLLRQDNFQGETGTVDVDKHMMAYIEEEMAKRRAAAAGSSASSSAETGEASAPAKRGILRTEDELYAQAAQESRRMQNLEAAATSPLPALAEKEEGNVTLSSAMLSSVPEFDLGIETKLKNIQDTERAKRGLFENRKVPPTASETASKESDDAYASNRFMRSKGNPQSDQSASRLGNTQDGDATRNDSSSSNRRVVATDQQVLDRFKKRERERGSRR